jgi:methenyltetrahydromethanopterin cyclohydrolase
VTNTAEYDLLTFKTEREWAFRKIGTGSTTYLALNDASGGKWFNIGMLKKHILMKRMSLKQRS